MVDVLIDVAFNIKNINKYWIKADKIRYIFSMQCK